MATILVSSTSYSVVDRAKTGNQDAENEICRIYQPIVVDWSRKFYDRNIHDATDLAQNLFIKIRSILQNYNPSLGQSAIYLSEKNDQQGEGQ